MTWLEPWFLLAATAAVVPLLLHLMHRQRAPRRLYSSLRFLRVSVQRTRRRKIVQDWLLLLARVLILMLLAVALARPAVRSLHGWLAAGRGLSVAIVLDNSGSMAAVDGAESRFERARRVAREILATLQAGDRVAVFCTVHQELPGVGKLYTDHGLVLELLERTQVVPAAAALGPSVAEAVEVLRRSKAAGRELYIITDAQARDWDGAEQWLRSVRDTTVLVVDVSRSSPPNAGIAELELLSPGPLVGLPVIGTIEVHNGGTGEQTRRVEWLADGRRVASSEAFTLRPGETRSVTLRAHATRPGHQVLHARLTGRDALGLDDARYAVRQVRRRLRVALVARATEVDDPLDPAFYLAEVLTLGDPQSWPIRLETLSWEQMPQEPLAEYSALFACDAPPDRRPIIGALEEFVRVGGQLVWIVQTDDPVEPYRALAEASALLMPVEVESARSAVDEGVDGGWSLAWLDRRSRWLAPLELSPAAVQDVRVFRYVRCRPRGEAKTLARLETGDPLIVARPGGRGGVWFVAAALQVDWSTLPVDPLFVPLVTRLVFAAAEEQGGGELAVLCGQVFRYPVAEGMRPQELVLEYPDGERVRAPVRQREGQWWLELRVFEPGVYTVRSGARGTVVVRFAANPDPAESDLTRIGVARLERVVRAGGGRVLSGSESVSRQVERLRRGVELMEPLLVVVLALVVVEAFLANRVAASLAPESRGPAPQRAPLRPETVAELQRALARPRR